MKRPRPSSAPREFGAPWALSLHFTSWLATLLILGVATGGTLAVRAKAHWSLAILPLLVVLVPIGSVLFCIRGYVIEGRTLWVRRLLWNTALSLDGLESTEANPHAMRRVLRTCGNGGLFSFSGWFRGRDIGSFRAWVTDPARCVVLHFADQKWVVSPHDPVAFIAALGLPETRRKAGN